MLLNELFQEKIEEVSMSPGALKDFANTPFAQSMTAGFEAELVIPDVATDNVDEYDTEPDYDQDERIYSYEDIRNFFQGEYNSRRAVDNAIENMQEEFLDEAEPAFDVEMKDDIINYIRAAAKDDGMSEEEIDALMMDGADNSVYEKYLDDAKDEFRTDFYDNYFERWIRNNYRTMMRFSEAFDLTWPHWTEASSDGAGEVDIADVAVEIQDAIGMKVRGSSSYHSTKRGTDFFILEPDSSIDADEDDGEAGLELISPPMPLAQCLEYLEKVFGWAIDKGCRTNKSTGFHMGISIPGQSMDNVDHLKFILFLGDEYVLRQFGREANTYTTSMTQKIIKNMSNKEISDPGAIERVFSGFKTDMNSVATVLMKRSMTSTGDRFVSVNIKENYIEVRSAGGNYLRDLDKIKNTLLRYVRAMGLAADPEAEKQEYAKKLYKMLAPSMQSKEEDVIGKYFSMYSAGNMPATALKSFLKQVQMKRAGTQQSDILSKGPKNRHYKIIRTSDGLLVHEFLAADIAQADQMMKQYVTDRLGDPSKYSVEYVPPGARTTPAPQPAAGSPSSTAGTYVVTYRSPNDGEQRTAIDANSAAEAEEWFKSNHPSTYQILNVSPPIQRR